MKVGKKKKPIEEPGGEMLTNKASVPRVPVPGKSPEEILAVEIGTIGAVPVENDFEEAPPVMKSWRNLYLLVLGNLLAWILLFTFFTWIFK